jgi:putative transcriptional regulator
MRKSIKNAIGTTVQGLIKSGVGTSFSEKQLKELGVDIPDVQMDAKKIQKIRNTTKFSQSVFAKLLNVSPSSIRQWEQGKRRPTGSTQVLLDLLTKKPHILDYRIKI